MVYMRNDIIIHEETERKQWVKGEKTMPTTWGTDWYFLWHSQSLH